MNQNISIIEIKEFIRRIIEAIYNFNDFILRYRFVFLAILFFLLIDLFFRNMKKVHKKIKIPMWLKLKFNDFINGYEGFKNNFHWYFLGFALTAFLFAMSSYAAMKMLLSKPIIFFHSIEGTLIYAQLVIAFNSTKFQVGIAYLSVLCIWFFIAVLSIPLIEIFSESLSRLFIKNIQHFSKINLKYDRILRKKLIKIFGLIRWIGLLIAVLVLFGINIFKKNLIEMLDVYYILLVSYIPVVYASMYTFYLVVRKRRKTKKSQLNFDKFIFSEITIPNIKKVVIYGIILFAIISRILIPSLFNGFDWIDNTATFYLTETLNYEKNWNFMINDGFVPIKEKTIRTIELPEPKKIKNSISLVYKMTGLSYEELKKHLSNFQQIILLALVISLFFHFTIPTIISFIFIRGSRETIRKIFYTVMYSLIMELILFIVIDKIFLMNIFGHIGIVTIFIFLFSILFSRGLDNIRINSEKI